MYANCKYKPKPNWSSFFAQPRVMIVADSDEINREIAELSLSKFLLSQPWFDLKKKSNLSKLGWVGSFYKTAKQWLQDCLPECIEQRDLVIDKILVPYFIPWLIAEVKKVKSSVAGKELLSMFALSPDSISDKIPVFTGSGLLPSIPEHENCGLPNF